MNSGHVSTKLDNLFQRVRGVRRWLVLLALLQASATCFAAVAVYFALFSFADYHLHLHTAARVVSLIGLMGIVGWLAYRLGRLLLPHLKCVHAAHYIDRRAGFEQQLVTVIEYHESGGDYPYSRALANELVHHVDRMAQNVPFDKVVPKRRVYALSAAAALGLLVAGIVFMDNYAYLSRHLARLVAPLAPIDPLPPTLLRVVGGDLVAAAGESTPLTAAIEGPVPDEGRLVVTREDAAEEAVVRDARLRPTQSTEGYIALKDSVTLEEGRYQYRFEARDTASERHAILVAARPGVKHLESRITSLLRGEAPKVWEEVKGGSIEVIEGSEVELRVESTQPLSGATFTGLAGNLQAVPVDNASFNIEFKANREGFIRIAMTSQAGLDSKDIVPIQVSFKKDMPPEFEYVSPGEDYLASNVASIPIEFSVKDDVRLEKADLVCEIAEREPLVVPAVLDAGGKTANAAVILELEEYGLSPGDSILVYARARDVDTGVRPDHRDSTGPVHFIEIRPYRQAWFQAPPQLPTQPRSGLEAEMHDRLIDVLEYTRAIFKKTWDIAASNPDSPESRSKAESIRRDLAYTIDQLTQIRDDERYGWPFEDKLTMNSILDAMRRGDAKLAAYNAADAAPLLKDAYQRLRKFVRERFGDVSMGQAREKGPEKLKIEENIHLSRLDKERVQWELKRLAGRLNRLEVAQDRMGKKFERFLKEAREQDGVHQKTADERSSTEPGAEPESQEGQQGGGTPPSTQKHSEEGPQPAMSSQGGEAQSRQSQPSTEESEERNPEAEQTGQGLTGGTSQRATLEDRARLMQAMQAALRGEMEGLAAALDAVSQAAEQMGNDSGEAREARRNARDALAQAVESARNAEAALSEVVMNGGDPQAALDAARQALAESGRALAAARDALEKGLTLDDQERLARELERRARELGDAADALDASLSPEERARMEALLEEAKQYLAMMPGEAARMASPSPLPARTGQDVRALAPSQGGAGGVGRAGKSNAPYAGEDAGETARLLAQQFWSKAIEVRQRRGALQDGARSDAEFHREEIQFYEEAARFGERGD